MGLVRAEPGHYLDTWDKAIPQEFFAHEHAKSAQLGSKQPQHVQMTSH